ncbi:MAG: hypothetical protein NC829_02260 [Candidatus Omnitrophica bacterium]|nr:hypothetical protein [Candidatus Omnitrophota bacterium]
MKKNKKAIVLVLVLGTILLIVILSYAIVSIMLSQGRLTKHQVDRTKAMYAARAGMIYALEMLRLGCWTAPGSYAICNQTSICSPPNYTDTDLPFPVEIQIGTLGSGVNGTTPINITVNYSYQP